MEKYLNLCPDRNGSVREQEKVNNNSLKVWRARGTIGDRKLLTGPLGINSIKACFTRINNRLPADLQVTKITAHGFGRRTHISSSVNHGTDPSVVAFASKHKDPKTLMLYVAPDDCTLSRSAISIAKSLQKEKCSTSYAGYTVDIEEEYEEE